MTTNDHPLSEAAAVELWNESRPACSWATANSLRNLYDPDRSHPLLTPLRAAFDAGREHEREHADPTIPAEVTDEMVKSALRAEDSVSPHAGGDGIDGFRLADERRVRAALEAALAVTTPATSSEPTARTILGVPDTHGAPHHDMKAIKAGDFVVQVDKDGSIRAGIAHYQDAFGEWHSDDSRSLIWVNDASADRPDAVTVWPAPTPPAEEVELPDERPDGTPRFVKEADQ